MIKDKTNKLITLLVQSLVLVSLTTLHSFAQRPEKISNHDDWSIYTYTDDRFGKICYILSVPKTKKPIDRDHGDVFFLVSQKLDGSSGFEPQLEVGYPLKLGYPVVITIGKKSFDMFTKDNSAWLKNISEEGELLDAMRAGKIMKVEAQSIRGTQTTYTYSLSGITLALEEIISCN
ncbi:hypothetical protein [Candidatus Endowatersipora endosymbiont of Watersipora subatra]|uniref:hypothetical protein n=1 Tax=Candidatus Endowatersipora endosymbiont of Watersipora subatra TaxID=3077946 RepID=UPI00312C8B14